MSIIKKLLDEKCGFVSDKDLPEVIKENRFQQIMVRCGAGRFVCPAQDVQHFVSIIEKEKSDYIRDISIISPGNPFRS